MITILIIVSSIFILIFYKNNYSQHRNLILLSFYILFLFIFPNDLGFKLNFDFRLRQIISILFLLPIFIQSLFNYQLSFDKFDLLLLITIIIGSLTYLFFTSNLIIWLGSFLKSFIYFFLPYYISKVCIKNSNDLIKIFKVILFSSVIVCVLAFYEYYTQTPYLQNIASLNPEGSKENIIIERYGIPRINVSFGYAIYLGVFISFILYIFIILLTSKNRKFNNRQILYIIIFSIISSCVILISQSRTSFFTITISLIIVMVIFHRKFRIKTILSYLLIFLPLLTIGIYYFFSNYFLNFFEFGITSENADENWVARLLNVERGMNIFFNNINWIGESNRYNIFNYSGNFEISNGFIDPLTKYGVFYFILYLTIWAQSIKLAYANRRSSIYGFLLFCSLIFFFISNNITGLYNQIEVLFYIIIGLVHNTFLFSKKIYSEGSRTLRLSSNGRL